MALVSWPNDPAHRHGGENAPIWERDPELKSAIEDTHDAVFGAANCSALDNTVDDFNEKVTKKLRELFRGGELDKLPTTASTRNGTREEWHFMPYEGHKTIEYLREFLELFSEDHPLGFSIAVTTHPPV